MRSAKIPQIQALRAIAATLVLVYHAKLIPGGYVGVDIFYVISGYLITGLIIRELESAQKFDFSKFYARRAKRLIPSSLLVVICTGIVGWIVLPSSMRQTFGRDLIAASTYVSNFFFALWQNDYQNLNSTPSPFIHYWSLAVEEQFYLFWPLIVVILYKIGKKRAILIGSLFTVAFSFMISLITTNLYPIWSFYILPARAWELGIGALILFIPSKLRLSKIFVYVAFFGLIFSSFKFNETTAFPGLAALVPVISTAILVHSHNNWPNRLSKISRLPLVQWLGAISYPLYLWHWPLLVLPAIALGRTLSIVEKVLIFLIIFLLSAFTHRYVEEPARHHSWGSKRTFKYVSVATAGCVLLGLSIYVSYSNSFTVGSGKKFSLEDIRQNPVNYEDGCHIHRGVTRSPACQYGDPYGKETIVLYGDSHAAQWLPALDIIGKKRHVKIISLTKSACSATELVLPLSSQYSVSDCQKFRDNSITRIKKLSPIAVITSSYQQLKATDGSADPLAWWISGQAKLLERLKPITLKSVYITDTPRPTLDIPDCLSKGAKSDCDGSLKLNPTTAPGFIAIDPTGWLCQQSCPAIVDGLVAYRDQSHISVAMSKHLAPRLESVLKAHGVL